MADKPEALRLADELGGVSDALADRAADELRRLHAVNAELTEDLEKKSTAIQRIWKERDELRKMNAELLAALRLIAATDPVDAALDPQRAVRVARAAIAKAEGQQ